MVRDWLSFRDESKWLAARGMLDEGSMNVTDESFRLMLRYPGFRAAWQLSKYSVGKATRDFVAAETAGALSKGLPPTYEEGWRSAISSENVASIDPPNR